MKSVISVSERLRGLRRDEGGAAMIEFTLVFFLLMIMTFGVFELAIAMLHYNAAEAATQRGARMAVESDPVAPIINTYNAVEDSGMEPGETLSGLAPFALRCDATACVCHSGTCSAIGTPDHDPAAFAVILAEMQTLLPDLTANDVLIDYRHVGLGFAGRPGSDIVPMVAVQIRNQVHTFVVMEAFGVPDWTMPPFPTILPGEDLDSSGS